MPFRHKPDEKYFSSLRIEHPAELPSRWPRALLVRPVFCRSSVYSGRLLRTTTGAIVIDSVQTVQRYPLILDDTRPTRFQLHRCQAHHFVRPISRDAPPTTVLRTAGGSQPWPMLRRRCWATIRTRQRSPSRRKCQARLRIEPVRQRGAYFMAVAMGGLQDRAATDAAEYEAG